ncbi:hypothetical protein [Francisella philomiragia]|uniref:hypothetical protein n=1 Tax=Francisella philomiragia TaxID=28110 RepID=UPI0019081173|nr:hypothetical protein [Francisella philomiragia]
MRNIGDRFSEIKKILSSLNFVLYFLNLKKIKSLKNKYQDKRCFIIGSGPSLKNIDLSLLNNEFTFVCNRGYLLKELGLESANFYGLSDVNAAKEYGNKIPNNFADLFLTFGKIKLKNKKQINFKFANSNHLVSKGYFQLDLVKPVAHSYTVVLQMLHVAVWMGFVDIYFIGVDNDFNKIENLHWYKDSKKERDNMVNWNFDPCEDNKKAFGQAYELLKLEGINIYNAGIGGELDTIPRINFNKVVNNEQSYSCSFCK